MGFINFFGSLLSEDRDLICASAELRIFDVRRRFLSDVFVQELTSETGEWSWEDLENLVVPAMGLIGLDFDGLGLDVATNVRKCFLGGSPAELETSKTLVFEGSSAEIKFLAAVLGE